MLPRTLFTEGLPEECVRDSDDYGIPEDNEWYGLSAFEIACVYPKLGKTYFTFEKFYDATFLFEWMRDRPLLPIVACVLYGIAIVVGRAYFSTRPAWSWRRALAMWNLSLALFSTAGAFRLVPHLIHNLTSYPFRELLCSDPRLMYAGGSTGLWLQLFILSKFPELIDTMFIIVHKKPLIFLHWYHHITVLLYCWVSYVTESPPGLFFAAMNYCVHAVMYGYYFLMAMKMRPKWFKPVVITGMQILQMAIGVSLTLAGLFYNHTSVEGNTCKQKRENNVAAFVMYGSYFFLFSQLFLARYIKARVQGKKLEKLKFF